ncbi:uncharacterized protein UV8b_00060 [Ustilaginoidea virens]|uniref:E2 ubiquitin-conjugating enzyme n=1 Tax=Ustilaginoidea virens TaxID=1159556 RepID=A0A8E5HI48_USTVR|nr:uncharacterized protein UV8b_00060 [Ustilaginoidea virens]QUC15819.1 hypothetical protein UV8b_00060 [Ustilaginoidea virens]
MSTKRITKEYAEVSQTPPDGYTVRLPNDSSIHTWHLTLAPPPSTPYHPGRYGVLLTLPADYPFRPPAVRFVTRLYHPNVTNDALGHICLGILKPENWKPSTRIAAVLLALRDLLVEPQPDDPLEDAIAHEYKSDRAAWEKNVRAQVGKYAMAEPVFPAVAT